MGVFWKKAGGRAAFVTMVSGGGMGAVCFFFDFFKDYVIGKGDIGVHAIAASPVWGCIYNFALKDFMLTSFGMFVICVIIQIVASLAMPEPLKEEARTLVWDHWSEPLKAKCGSGLSDYRVMSAAVLVMFVMLYWLFW